MLVTIILVFSLLLCTVLPLNPGIVIIDSVEIPLPLFLVPRFKG
uniref:Uncharacterized protein n=1 Tax=Arundo donax TaxID=35708 RepID=A0A0A8XYW6_ARUDO